MTTERITRADGRPILRAHIVDPDPNADKMLRMVLESLELEVSIQNMTHNIVATLEKLMPDFVVTELDLGEQDLFKVLEEVYRDRRFARTKFLVCTAHADAGPKHLYRKYHLDRFYDKPLNADKFRRDLRHLISLKMKYLGWQGV
jgi:DNA-binding NtrC family response regulator